MALPGDVTTLSLNFGPYTNAEGLAALVAKGGKLFPVDAVTGRRLNVTHVASGQVIVPVDLPVVIAEDGTGSVGPIPHTDNPGLSPVGFAYRVEWNIPSNHPSPGNRVIALPTEIGLAADFDRLVTAEAAPGVLVPVGAGPAGPAGPEGIQGPPGADGADGAGVTVDGAEAGTLDIDSTPVVAADIPFTPTGTISAADVQSAITELMTEVNATLATVTATLTNLGDRVTLLEGGSLTYQLLTESGDTLTTESGDLLVTQ